MTMQTVCIRFFVAEGMKHHHLPIHEWLFGEAAALGIPGGTAFRAAAGYGRHGLHEDSFFELAGKLPETVEFFAEADRVEALVSRVGAAGLRLVYVVHPVTAGMTGA
jgi:uncharacterized protein